MSGNISFPKQEVQIVNSSQGQATQIHQPMPYHQYITKTFDYIKAACCQGMMPQLAQNAPFYG